MRYYNKNLDFDDSLHLEEITIKAIECSEKCPVFYFNAKRAHGYASFIGTKFTKKEGEHAVFLRSTDWVRLDSLFKWSNIRRADTSVYYGAADDWLMEIEVKFNGSNTIKVEGTQDFIYYETSGKRYMEKIEGKGIHMMYFQFYPQPSVFSGVYFSVSRTSHHMPIK